MTLNNNSGTQITLDEAEAYTHAFQEDNPNAIKSFFVGARKLELILNQEDCMGIRIYNGYDTDQNNKANLVVVGVNEDGEDMTNGVILEKFVTCPSICPESSPLIKVSP